MNRELIKKEIKDALIAVGFKANPLDMYYTYDITITEDKWLEFYPFEMRLRYWWEGVDEREGHRKVKNIIFECSHIQSVAELNKCFSLCHVDIRLKEPDKQKAFENAAKPMMDFIKENYHPHCSAIITATTAELLEGQIGFSTNLKE